MRDRDWEAALERYRPVLLMLAERNLDPRFWRKIPPEDIIQITLADADRCRHQLYSTSEEGLHAWLRKILFNRMMDEIRKVKARGADIDLEVPIQVCTGWIRTGLRDTCTPSRVAMQNERQFLFARALDRLPKDHRQAIVMVRLHEMTFESAAQIMNRTKGGVAGLVHRATLKLHVLLRESGVTDV